MAIDPVCEMEVDEETTEWASNYMGTAYYFCSPGCKASFDKEPAKYVTAAPGHEHHDHSHHHHGHDHG